MKRTLEMQENGLACLSEDGAVVYDNLNPLEARDIMFLVNEMGISDRWDVLEQYLPDYPREPVGNADKQEGGKR
jgi:hypothetical protein